MNNLGSGRHHQLSSGATMKARSGQCSIQCFSPSETNTSRSNTTSFASSMRPASWRWSRSHQRTNWPTSSPSRSKPPPSSSTDPEWACVKCHKIRIRKTYQKFILKSYLKCLSSFLFSCTYVRAWIEGKCWIGNPLFSVITSLYA